MVVSDLFGKKIKTHSKEEHKQLIDILFDNGFTPFDDSSREYRYSIYSSYPNITVKTDCMEFEGNSSSYYDLLASEVIDFFSKEKNIRNMDIEQLIGKHILCETQEEYNFIADYLDQNKCRFGGNKSPKQFYNYFKEYPLIHVKDEIYYTSWQKDVKKHDYLAKDIINQLSQDKIYETWN